MSTKIKLTQYSHGAGCGCKISPSILAEIIGSKHTLLNDPKLLVGNSTSDDAAVYDIGNNQAIISTTDFFMPIVDDPFDFGAIAATNALSDVYAMAGRPLMAIAILGWPIDKIDPSVASQVMDGGRSACEKAGIHLAGGHSIDCPEPIFGLAVTGIVDNSELKRNSTARSGSKLFLTKKLGVGIIATAQKKGLASGDHIELAISSMKTLNDFGAQLGKLPFVNALTDVTGFGLLGHLNELCQGSGLSASIDFSHVPKFDFLSQYISQEAIPGGTKRNWDSYGSFVKNIKAEQLAILADPQTSGGLLISVDENHESEFIQFGKKNGLSFKSFGTLESSSTPQIEVV
ncbi:MAG: selenide, water dikinase SelD [Cyclobacteriaceae bacterium]